MPRGKRAFFKKSILVKMLFYTSQTTIDKLIAMTRVKKVPLSTLINRALDNEFGAPTPFMRDLSLNEEGYVDEDTPEAIALYKFMIDKSPTLSVEHMIDIRDQIGVSDIGKLKMAVIHLLKIGQLEEVFPLRPKFGGFEASYRTFRVPRDKQKPVKKPDKVGHKILKKLRQAPRGPITTLELEEETDDDR